MLWIFFIIYIELKNHFSLLSNSYSCLKILVFNLSTRHRVLEKLSGGTMQPQAELKWVLSWLVSVENQHWYFIFSRCKRRQYFKSLKNSVILVTVLQNWTHNSKKCVKWCLPFLHWSSIAGLLKNCSSMVWPKVIEIFVSIQNNVIIKTFFRIPKLFLLSAEISFYESAALPFCVNFFDFLRIFPSHSC